MAKLKELQDNVDKAQEAFDTALKAWKDSKTLLNRRGDNALKDAMIAAEKVLNAAKIELEEYDGPEEQEDDNNNSQSNKPMAKTDDVTKAQDRHRQNTQEHNALCEEYSRSKDPKRRAEIEAQWVKLEEEREDLKQVINS